MTYRYLSHLTFPDAVATPAYPSGYPTEGIALAPTADRSGKPWRIVGHEHSTVEISGGRLHIDEYQSQSSFSNAVFQCTYAGSDFAVDGDFTIAFTHNTMNHNLYASSTPAGMVTATSYASGPNAIGEWNITNFLTTGRHIAFVQSTPMEPVTGNYAAVVSTAAPGSGFPAFVQPQNVDYRVRIERGGGVLKLYVDDVQMAQQQNNFGSFPLTPMAPTIGGYIDGGHYLPNNYGTGDYADFVFGVPAIALVYPATLPCPQSLTAESAERRVTSSQPFQSRGIQRDRLATWRVVFPPFDSTEAAIFRQWWKETLVFGGAWFSASWPNPQNAGTCVFRFQEAPRREFIRGVRGNFWRISAVLEIRGAGEPPYSVR